MDDIDLAQVREEVILRAALAARESSLTSPNAMCVWCLDEPIVADTAFCCAECGEDYRKDQREKLQRRI